MGYVPKSRDDPSLGKPLSGVLSSNTLTDVRLEKLERALYGGSSDEEGCVENLLYNNGQGLISDRNSVKSKGTLGRIRSLEEKVQALQTSLRGSETEAQEVKSMWQHNKKFGHASIEAAEMQTRVMLEVKNIERKVRKLAENTSKTCTSLSQGLNDVQHATLNLYVWSDSVHEAFDRVGKKLLLPGELCPRAKVARKSNQQRSMQDFMLDDY